MNTAIFRFPARALFFSRLPLAVFFFAGALLATAPSADVPKGGEPAQAPAPGPEGPSMEVVRVVGKTAQAVSSAHVVDFEQLGRFGETDIHQAVSQVPGVYFRGEEGYGLRPNIAIRGSYGDRSGKITLMEDGVLIAPAPYVASSAYYFPTVGRLHGVEVLKGFSAITQGPYTIGGAVNLLSTPIPEETGGSLRQELGGNGNRRTHLYYGGRAPRAGWLLEAHLHDTDGFDRIARSSNDTGFDKRDYMGKLRLTSDPNGGGAYHQLDFKYQQSRENSEQTYVGLAEADFRDNPRRRYGLTAYDNFTGRHEGAHVNYRVDFGAWEFNALVFRNEFERDWFKVHDLNWRDKDGDTVFDRDSVTATLAAANMGSTTALSVLRGEAGAVVRLKHNNREYFSEGAALRALWRGERHRVELGLRHVRDEEDRFQNYEFADQSADGALSALRDPTTPSGGDNRVTDGEGKSLYLHHTLTGRRLTWVWGVRREEYRVEQTRYTDAARTAPADGYPRRTADGGATVFGTGLNWKINGGIELFASYHRGFSPVGGDADPEEADNIEAGFRAGRGAHRLEMTAFRSDYKNLVGECRNSNQGVFSDCQVGDTFNGGKADIEGLELLSRHDFGLGGNWRLPVSLVYTRTRARFGETFGSDFWGDVTAGDAVPYTPENQFNATARLESPHGWAFHARLNYHDASCSQAACGDFTEIEEHMRWDAGLAFPLFDGATVYLLVENVTNEADIVSRSPQGGARGQKPRLARLGFRWVF